MERIEDLLRSGASAKYEIDGREVWLPALPLPFYNLKRRLTDAWAVFNDRAAAVQWPHHRERKDTKA